MLSKNFKVAIVFATIALLSAPTYGRMTDEQVVNYVKEQYAAGKSKEEIGRALLAKGVTETQLKNIQRKYEGGSLEQGGNAQSNVNASRTRSESVGNEPIDISEIEIIERPAVVSNSKIYGHNVFTNRNLTFAPSQNLATPLDYVLGPGDQVYIDIWGASEDNIQATISPEGSIYISQIGPVYLNGLTVEQANKYLSRLFRSKYAGFDDQETQVNLTLGDIRSININIMGEVNVPGTYMLSPFSSVFAALYQAGGVNDLGSIRDVRVVRNGRTIAHIDLYDYIFHGKSSDNIRLQEEDIIIVPSNTNVVTVSGNVKRPMDYEMLPTESISKLLQFAGGFSGNAYVDMVTVARNDDIQNVLINVPSDQFDTFTLQDGDVITVGQINGRFENRVELRGAVLRPGFYAIDDEINTLANLLRKSEGVLENAYIERALLYRQGDDLSLEVIPFNINNILSGAEPDIELVRNDVIMISTIDQILDRGSFTITGEVASPGSYPFAANTTIEDFIFMAGGLSKGASLVRADVARRVDNPYATQASDTIAQVLSFTIQDGLVISGNKSFYLEPYDIVQIRRSPGYMPQKMVTVDGEVAFVGQYALQNRNERISDIIQRAGGINPSAYVKGASLLRRMSDDEKIARDESLRLARTNQNSKDSVDINSLFVSDTYAVGIDLEAALNHPGSYDDIVLQDGDRITIPGLVSTVKISGDVMAPTVTTFVPGKKLSYYIDMAGGYGERARKNKTFVIYMNGKVEKVNRKTKIEPGCQIIVPEKPQSNGVNWAQIVSLTSAFSTLGTLAATLYNIFK